jgi:predicted DNA repair protein MutK
VSVGLIALLDDVAAIAKAAAASIDDVVAQAGKAGVKAAGVVIDDAAVTPTYVVGLSPSRELPMIWKITLGSLRNKLLILLPGALALSQFAPAAITPLLMIGGAYLCYEGAEKVYEKVAPHAAHAHESAVESVALDATQLENQKVAGAVKTDFILSAEIMAISLAAIESNSLWMRAGALAAVAVMITVGVYGVVALIVKMDDAGLALSKAQGTSGWARFKRAFGHGLVKAMPPALTALSTVGTAAMLWVGGQIVLHGLETFHLGWPAHFVHDLAEKAASIFPGALHGVANWLVSAALSGVFGLMLGLALIPVASYLISPLLRGVKRLFGKTPSSAGAH